MPTAATWVIESLRTASTPRSSSMLGKMFLTLGAPRVLRCEAQWRRHQLGVASCAHSVTRARQKRKTNFPQRIMPNVKDTPRLVYLLRNRRYVSWQETYGIHERSVQPARRPPSIRLIVMNVAGHRGIFRCAPAGRAHCAARIGDPGRLASKVATAFASKIGISHAFSVLTANLFQPRAK